MDNKKEFDQYQYIQDYERKNYTKCLVRFRDREAAILAEFSANLRLSKNALIQKCVVYCYDNMIDVSGVKLSTPEK